MITDVEGIAVGHWTDDIALTGCTVVLFPDGTVASGEVRGGAPATREFALLDPSRIVTRLDALVLSGGSAFGLAACDGVMDWCEQAGRGFPTAGGIVPIVVGLSLYDLAIGDGTVRPRAEHGAAAAHTARSGLVETGRVGAGTGATVRKWSGAESRRRGGLVTATRRVGPLTVSCLVAVNAWGEPGGDPAGVTAALASALRGHDAGPSFVDQVDAPTNTTIGVVATDAALDKSACHLVAQAAHHGLARAVLPSHTGGDGDAFVAASCGSVEAPLELVRLLATVVVADAIDSLPAAAE